MSLAFKLVAAMLIVSVGASLARLARHDASSAGALRVCADPNNLPFSNRDEQGFENVLAGIIAQDLHRRVAYTWWPQRRGFIRTTLRAGVCDVVMGVPVSFELTRNTRPYYRSAYAFITRPDRPAPTSLDDPRLRGLVIGVPLPGNDYANVPPADALAARGMATNLRGYSITGDYSTANPPAAVVDAVERGDVDVAVAWGPIAGFFASRADVPLDVTPIPGEADAGMQFDIAVGVRRSDRRLARLVDDVLARRRPEIEKLLARFHVPQLPLPATPWPKRRHR